jgi:hypothetical protein
LQPGIGQKELVDAVRDRFGGMPDAKVPGVVKVRGTIKAMAQDGLLQEGGAGNGRTYYVS